MTLGEKILTCRKKLGLSQEALAEKLWSVDGYAMVNGQLVSMGQVPPNPMEIITGFIIGLGVVLLIAGVVLAIVLHPKKK